MDESGALCKPPAPDWMHISSVDNLQDDHPRVSKFRYKRRFKHASIWNSWNPQSQTPPWPSSSWRGSGNTVTNLGDMGSG